MPLEITTDGPWLRITAWGRLVNDELAALAREAVRIESELDHVPHRLTDLRMILDPGIDFSGVRDFADHRLRQKYPNSFKSAIVAADPAHYGLARMYQTLNDHPQITVAIFPDIATAEAWLAMPGTEPPAKPWSPPAT